MTPLHGEGCWPELLQYTLYIATFFTPSLNFSSHSLLNLNVIFSQNTTVFAPKGLKWSKRPKIVRSDQKLSKVGQNDSNCIKRSKRVHYGPQWSK